MKKNLFFIAVLLAFVVAFTACNDKDETVDPTPDSADATSDYTVIFWGMSGGCEGLAFQDLLEMQQMREDGRISDKVNFYGLLKTSDRQDAQTELKPYGYDGTLLIDKGTKTGNKLGFSSLLQTADGDVLDYGQCADILKEFHATRYADATYPLDSADSLANFIKKAVKKYPAKKYILMVFGHGSGYDPTEEVANASAYTTRGCVYDDMNDQKCLTADNLVAAVRNSGTDISMIFFQCCLMATLENIAAYQHCTDYILASCETTTGGYMQQFLANISQAGTSDESLKKASEATVDYYVGKCENDECSSHGFYDLTKSESLLATVREIASWYSQAYDKDPEYINNAVSQATISLELESLGGAEYVDKRNGVLDVLNRVIAGDEFTDDELIVFCNDLMDILDVPVSQGFVFSAFVKGTIDGQADATGADMDFSLLQTLYSQYMQQLKDMSYIRANHEDSAVPDYCYLLTSPTVNIFTMNEENFHPTNAWLYYQGGTEQTTTTHMLEAKLDLFVEAIQAHDEETIDAMYSELFTGCYFARNCTLDKIEANYTASQFDKATGWSNFLKKLTQNPTYLTNPGRMSYTVK